MTGNRIGDEGTKAMSEMLMKNTTITELYLGSWDIKKGKGKEK